MNVDASLASFMAMTQEVTLELFQTLPASTTSDEANRIAYLVGRALGDAFKCGAEYGTRKTSEATVEVAAHLIKNVIVHAQDRIADE